MKKILLQTCKILTTVGILLYGIFLYIPYTFALSTTLSYAGTANDLWDSTMNWTTPWNAVGNTTTTSANGIIVDRNINTNTLALTNFNLAAAGLPSSGIIINGIQIDVEWMVASNRVRDARVQLTKDGSTWIGTNLANNAAWPTTKSITTYGWATNLWGTTWTPADLLSPNFGVLLQYVNTRNRNRRIDVYRVMITIDYTIVNTPVLSVTNVENDGDNTVTTGQIVQYTVSIANSGTNASWISSISSIDANMGTPYNFNYSNCWTPSQSFTAPNLNFSNISILGGNTCIITYDVQVNTGAPWGANITNSADVSAALEWGNNPAPVSATILTVLACGVNDVNIVFETDNYWEDTFWSLVPTTNACGVGQLSSWWNPNLTCADGWLPASANAADPYADNSIITEGPFSLTVGNQYDLHVIDDYGDGILAADPDVRIQQNGVDSNIFNVTNNGGIFTFTVQTPTGCIDTISPNVTINQAPTQADPTNVNSATFRVVFDEVINTATFTASDISLTGTTWVVSSGPTEIAPNNGTSFEFTVTGMTTGDVVTATIPASWIADIAGNLNNPSTSTDNQVTYNNADITPPTISSINFASGSLLPGWNHNIIINYSDSGGIDVTSDTIALYKWNGSIWWPDISATGLNLGSKTITSSTATYPTNNLDFWKYRYDFSISDNSGNTSSTGAVFYIDIPEFIISTGSIDIGWVNNLSPNFSNTVTVTVKTVWAAFNVFFNRNGTFDYGSLDSIPSWNSIEWYWYEASPFSGTINTIGLNETIASQVSNINVNGNKNTYTYDIKIWALVNEFQSAWDYLWALDFWINLTY